MIWLNGMEEVEVFCEYLKAADGTLYTHGTLRHSSRDLRQWSDN